LLAFDMSIFSNTDRIVSGLIALYFGGTLAGSAGIGGGGLNVPGI
jgi:hypothetical protein